MRFFRLVLPVALVAAALSPIGSLYGAELQPQEARKPPTAIVQESYMVDGRSGKDYLRRGETDVLITTVTISEPSSGPAFAWDGTSHAITAEGVEYTLVRVHGREKYVANGPYEYVWAHVGEQNGAHISYLPLIEKKRYVQKELAVGVVDRTEIPLLLLAGTPFPCDLLKPQAQVLRPLTIRIEAAKGPLLIPAGSSLVPVRFQPFVFCSCAVGLTWEFTSAGITFSTDEEALVVEREGATLTFTKDGPVFDGIRRTTRRR